MYQFIEEGNAFFHLIGATLFKIQAWAVVTEDLDMAWSWNQDQEESSTDSTAP